jgi:hypothetical protein
MADTYTIQFRRGMYADFDTSKIRPGEPVAILGNDPSVPSGKALYIAFAANDVRRLCSIEDISEMVNAGEFVGPQGPKGEKGDKGADGTVAFESLTPEQKESLRGISIKSASIDTDGNLIITFSDGGSEDVGNIMGPQGIQGPKGDKGDVGPQGPKGDKGDVGPKGDNMSDKQAAQIEQNKTDIASLKKETGSLKEDLSNKITKFYASSQGETHLADSDNGKIMDMMLYGKSEQKQYNGKNLLNATLQTTTQNGVTCTNNGDGTYTLNGTATTITTFDIAQDVSCSSFRLVGCPVGGAHDASYELQARTNNLIYGYDTGDGKNIKADENFFIRIRINAGINCNNLLFKPMIVDASLYPDATYDDFEPYVGGQPSPSPDYPQEIKSVVNPTVKVCGKNLLELPISNKSTQAGITFEVINDSVIKITGINNGSRASQYVAYNSQEVKYAKLIPYKNIAITISTYNDDVIAGLAYWLKSENYATVHYKQNKRKCTIDLGEDAKIVPWFFIPQNGTYTNDTVKFGVYYGTDELTYDAPKCHTVTLPYTLNAIPVSAGGNVTIDGQQYIADYVDVERGKLVRMVANNRLLSSYNWNTANEYYWGNVSAATNGKTPITADNSKKMCACKYLFASSTYDVRAKKSGIAINNIKQVVIGLNYFASVDDLKTFLANNDVRLVYPLEVPTEIDLTSEEIAAFKALATYYPTTNISINSEQLDGYTVFNYPISMENGWNYVKQQIGDTRDYIYDMDARAQDTDLQAAEAYVNSEYAVALTELEV